MTGMGYYKLCLLYFFINIFDISGKSSRIRIVLEDIKGVTYMDERIKTLAKNLVNYSCRVQKGENVMISCHGKDPIPLVKQIIKEVYKAGGTPFVEIKTSDVEREMLLGATEQQLKLMAELECEKMRHMQAYIGVRGDENLTELAEIFRRADVVISPDSGSAHIAWAVEKPFVITVFTATSALRNAPFGENCVSFYPEIDCYPCMKRKCRRKKEKNICCTAVSPEKIVNILKNILHYD